MDETQARIIKSLFANHQGQLAELGVADFYHPWVSPVVWVESDRKDLSPAAGEVCIGDTHFYRGFSPATESQYNKEGERVMVQLIGTVASGATALLEGMNRIYSRGDTPPAGQVDVTSLAKILQLPEILFGNVPLAHSQLGIYRHLGPYRELLPQIVAPTKNVVASGTVSLEDGTVLM